MDLKPSEIAKMYNISRQWVYDKQDQLTISREKPLTFTIESVNRVFGSPPIDSSDEKTIENALLHLKTAQEIMMFLLKGSDHV